MNKEIKIQLTEISKVFYTDEIETHALRGINLSIYAGDYLTITGPSGCGKSTLLSILGLLDSPTSGKYIIEDEDVSSLTVDQRAVIRNKKIGFIFQAFNLIDELNIFDNVALPLRYRQPSLSAEETKERVLSCLEQVQMSHRANHSPNQVSGGQQQRVAIARALVGFPTMLLVDEPTGNLDSKNGDAVMDMLAELNENGTTICMVTHDPRYAGMAKTQLHLSDGVLLNDLELGETA